MERYKDALCCNLSKSTYCHTIAFYILEISMKKKRMKWLISPLLILCIGLFAALLFCNDHSQQQFEEEAALSVAVPDISQTKGEVPAIEDKKRTRCFYIRKSREWL